MADVQRQRAVGLSSVEGGDAFGGGGLRWSSGIDGGVCVDDARVGVLCGGCG